MGGVDRVPIAIVAVGDHGNRNRVIDFNGGGQLIVHVQDIGVRQAVRRGDFESARPDGVEARPLPQNAPYAIMGANQQQTLLVPK